MNYKVLVKPSLLPVTVGELKNHLNILNSYTADDAILTTYISAATEQVEALIQSPVMEQQWLLQGAFLQMIIPIWKYPVISIDEVAYYDVNESNVVIAPANYYLDDASRPCRLIFKSSFSLPSLADRHDAVRIKFTAGYQQQSDVPSDIRTFVLLFAAYLYENRLVASERNHSIPDALNNIVSSRRLWL